MFLQEALSVAFCRNIRPRFCFLEMLFGGLPAAGAWRRMKVWKKQEFQETLLKMK